MKTLVDVHMKQGMEECRLEEFPAGEKIRGFYLKRAGGGRMGSVMILFTPEGIIIAGDMNPLRRRGAALGPYGLKWFASSLEEDYLCGKFLDEEWQSGMAIRYCRQMAAEILQGLHDSEVGSELRKLSDERAGLTDDIQNYRRDRNDVKAGDDSALQKEEDLRNLRNTVDYQLRQIHALKKRILELRTAAAQRYLVLAKDTEEDFYGPERFGMALQEIDPNALDDGVPGYGYDPVAGGWLCAIQQRFRELHAAEVVKA